MKWHRIPMIVTMALGTLLAARGIVRLLHHQEFDDAILMAVGGTLIVIMAGITAKRL